MKILGVNTGHDAASAIYVDGDIVAFCKEERVTRIKSDSIKRLDKSRVLLKGIDEVLEISGLNSNDLDMLVFTRMDIPAHYYYNLSKSLKDLGKRLRKKPMGLATQMYQQQQYDEAGLLDYAKIRKDLGLRDDCQILFANHHLSHILGAFCYTTWGKDALYISADGGGDFITYGAYGFDGATLKCLYGGDDFLKDAPEKRYAASIGQAYSDVTKLLGFKANRHEGKITGLAAFGKPVHSDAICKQFIVRDDGVIDSVFSSPKGMWDYLSELNKGSSREEMAASIQYATEKIMVEWVQVLLKLFPARYIGMSGGVFSNVRLNQFIAELPGIEEVFVCPPMGDEGLPVGNCMFGVMQQQGVMAVPRKKLDHCYLGRHYTGQQLFDAARQGGFEVREYADAAQAAAELLANNEIGAIYTQSMEMGPRALGGRSIIASPVDRGLNDSLNGRLERTEFMPFAPYVLDVDADRVFDINDVNREACRFMTITTGVKEKYREQIQAVVHVDNTARPQIIERKTNPLYYDILKYFRDATGIPCLVNTSFNAHEEPIINTPQEALKALYDKRIDFLVCDAGLVFREGFNSTFKESQ